MADIIFAETLNANGNGWNGYTGVTRFAVAGLTLPSGTIARVRATFRASSAESFTLANSYIGHRAASGDAYDFDATPVQFLFSGNAGKVIAAGTEEFTDWATFAYNKTSDLLISYYCNGGLSSDAIRVKTGVANVFANVKIANEAATVNKTGYTTITGELDLINKIEVEVLTGANFITFF